MASLTLKNLPDDLLHSLRDAAERERRSLNQQIIYLLDKALRAGDHPSAPSASAEAQVEAWRRIAGKWESDVDPTTEASRIMKGRSEGREVDF